MGSRNNRGTSRNISCVQASDMAKHITKKTGKVAFADECAVDQTKRFDD